MKLGNSDITLKVGSVNVDAAYIGTTLVYSASTPSFNGKWLATYTAGTTSSADCDSTSAITQNEITITDLQSVIIGDCVTSIGSGAFWQCSSLASIEISDSVTSIGQYTFQYCSSLTNCTIGSGVTSIGNYAFRGCSSLESVIVNATNPPMLGEDVFRDTNNCPIYVPSGSIMDYFDNQEWNTYSDRLREMPT